MDQQTPLLDSFVFSSKTAKKAKEEIDKRVDAIEDRISNLVSRVMIGSIPILGHILSLTRDPADLAKIGKACIRLSEIIPKADELKERQVVVNKAVEDPTWMALVFGDLGKPFEEIDAAIQSFDS